MTTIRLWAEDGKGRVAHREYEGLNEDISSFIEDCKAIGLTRFRLTRDRD